MHHEKNEDENQSSVVATIRSLEAAFSEAKKNNVESSLSNDEIPSVFTDEEVLRRPPFAYVHALAKFFSQRKPSLGWTELLLFDRHDDGFDFDHRPCRPTMTKREKLAFLSRLLAVVSRIDGRRHDVLVSPSGILCGRDVSATRDFLRALASSTMASEEVSSRAVKYVLKEGDAVSYKRGVRTRKGFTSLQAMARGRIARRRYRPKPLGENELTTTTDNDPDDASDPKVSNSGSECALENDGTEKAKSKSDGNALLESYQAMLARKSKVEEDLKAAEARLNRENDKLIRMLNLGTRHKTSIHVVPYAGMSRPPMSAPSMGRNIARGPLPGESHRTDEAFREKIMNFSERQRGLKQKERRIDERENRSKQRFARSKQKEIELKLQEDRISELAGKMRKQQLQLKEQRLQFERSRVLEPAMPPEETTRPCLLCTEKKMKMREARKRVRNRARELSQREADVVARAHELRRREREIAKRELILAEVEEQHSVVDDFLLGYEDKDEPPREEDDRRRRRRRQKERVEETVETVLSDVREDPDPDGKKGARKRRRQSSRADRPSTPKLLENVEPNNPLQSCSSFGESSITTIVEETPDEEQEDSIVEEVFKEVDAFDSTANASGTEAVSERRRSMKAIPTDIHRARQQLGISKSKKNAEGRRSTFGKTPREENSASIGAEMTRRVSQPLPPKKRHVFAFEKRKSHKIDNGVLCAESKSFGGDRGRAVASPAPTRARDRPRVSYEKHDDWISSFDAQMKCAVNRLKDLV